ncbi:MAG: hypothetical protein QXM16_04420 [Nitrososphaerota archaeon]
MYFCVFLSLILAVLSRLRRFENLSSNRLKMYRSEAFLPEGRTS